MAEDPPPHFPRRQFFSSRPLFDWRPDESPGCTPVWPQRPAEQEFWLHGQTARLSWQPDRAVLSLAAPIDADAVDRIDLEVKSLDGRLSRLGAAALLWRSQSQKFTVQRMVRDPAGRSAGDDAWLFSFLLGSDAGWRGNVTGLRVVLQPAVGSPLGLCSLRGAAEELLRERLPELVRRGYKVDVGGQTRNALPGLPDQPVERDLNLPRGAVLRFAYALPATVRQPATFHVELEVRGAPAEKLFQATLEPAQQDAWHEAVVDLGAFAGRQVRLRLVTTTASSLQPQRGSPLWGHPEVLAPPAADDRR